MFYFVTLTTALVNFPPMRETLLWHLTYMSNFCVALRGSWIGSASHFWSLAVEEQFYLLWPCLMLFLPNRFLLPCITTAIILAPAYKVIGFLVGLNSLALSTMMVGCLDSLGVGALLAFCRYKKPRRFGELVQSRAYNGLGFGLLAIVSAATVSGPHHYFVSVANTLVTSMFFAWLIHKAAVGFDGATGRLLETKPLLYLGKISYGLYIYHNFMGGAVRTVFRLLSVPYPERTSVLRLLLLTSVTIAVSSCSWHFFERPISDLKRRFDY